MHCWDGLDMTVGELMKALSKFDPDDEVFVRNPSEGFVSYDSLIMVCRCDLESMEGFETCGHFPLLVTPLSTDYGPVAAMLDELDGME